MARFRQGEIERAVRAAIKSGLRPSRISVGPDGSFSLCFGGEESASEDRLDRELEQWRSKECLL